MTRFNFNKAQKAKKWPGNIFQYKLDQSTNMNYQLRPLLSVEEYLLYFKKRQILNRRFVKEYEEVQTELEIDAFDSNSSHYGLFTFRNNKQIPLAFARITEMNRRQRIIPDQKPSVVKARCMEVQNAVITSAKLPIFEHFDLENQDLWSAFDITSKAPNYLEAGRLLVTEKSLAPGVVADFITYIISIAKYHNFDFLLTSVSESHSRFYSNFFGTNTIIKAGHDFSVPMVMSVFDLKKQFKRKAALSEQILNTFKMQGLAPQIQLSNSKILY